MWLNLFYHASFSAGLEKKTPFGRFAKHKFTINKLMFTVRVLLLTGSATAGGNILDLYAEGNDFSSRASLILLCQRVASQSN